MTEAITKGNTGSGLARLAAAFTLECAYQIEGVGTRDQYAIATLTSALQQLAGIVASVSASLYGYACEAEIRRVDDLLGSLQPEAQA